MIEKLLNRKGTIHQEEKSERTKGRNRQIYVTVVDINISLSVIDRSSRQKIINSIAHLLNIINQLDLINIYIHSYPKQNTVLSHTYVGH